MNNATLRFTTHWPYNPVSWLVARLGGSRLFSHCMLIVDGMAYEANMLYGCRCVPVDEVMRGVVAYQDMPLNIPNLDACLEFGNKQIKKRYDYAGVLGIPFLYSDEWSNDSSWWCSELNFMMLLNGGLTMLDPDINKRITPEDLRMCNFQKSEIIHV